MTEPTLRPFSEFIDIFRRLATEQPDRHARCNYFNIYSRETSEALAPTDRTPDCIGGHAYAELGAVSKTDIDNFGDQEHFVFVDDVEIIEEGQGISVTNWSALGFQYPNPVQRLWINGVQMRQDGRYADSIEHPWGAAVELTDKSLTESERAQLSE